MQSFCTTSARLCIETQEKKGKPEKKRKPEKKGKPEKNNKKHKNPKKNVSSLIQNLFFKKIEFLFFY